MCIDSEGEERDHPGTYFLYFMFLLFEIGNMRNDIHFDDDVLLLARPQPKFRITHRHTIIPSIKWSFIVETQQARNISPTIDKLWSNLILCVNSAICQFPHSVAVQKSAEWTEFQFGKHKLIKRVQPIRSIKSSDRRVPSTWMSSTVQWLLLLLLLWCSPGRMFRMVGWLGGGWFCKK